MATFYLYHIIFTALNVTQLFMDNIFKLHRVPASIVSDHDKIFLSSFWKELFKLLSTELKMSSTYHPQTNGQTEVLNKCLDEVISKEPIAILNRRIGKKHAHAITKVLIQ